MNAIKCKLLKAEIGSCTCLTKTHDPEYHDENCRYRILREVGAELDRMYAVEKENAELKHENHNLNVALGTTGYEEADWFTAEERKVSAEGFELIQSRIERMRQRKVELEEQAKDAARLAGLRELMGYVEDGSSTTVKLFQDDATKSFFVKVGRKVYFDSSFKGAIDEAMVENAK